MANSSTEFALDMYQALRGTKGNLFFSPFSIYTCLSMAYAGARGETEKQMATVLHSQYSQESFHRSLYDLRTTLRQSISPSVAVKSANSMWIQEGIPLEPAFERLLERDYLAAPLAADFQGSRQEACALINNWARENTGGRIDALLSPDDLSDRTRLMLLNAVYFKAKWAHEFDPEHTATNEFFVRPGKAVAALFMVLDRPMRCAFTNGTALLELPYRGHLFSMFVLLPPQEADMRAFESSLSHDMLRGLMPALQEYEMIIRMPKFEFEQTHDVTAALKELGMVKAFDNVEAEFHGMTTAKPLYINAVRQRAGLIVNEEGTEAWAVTTDDFALGAEHEDERKLLVMDHPFLFFICERTTGTIVFMGRVNNPNEAEPGEPTSVLRRVQRGAAELKNWLFAP